VDYLHKNNIPHNLVIVKCEEFMETESGKITLRVVIWPKKPEFGKYFKVNLFECYNL